MGARPSPVSTIIEPPAPVAASTPIQRVSAPLAIVPQLPSGFLKSVLDTQDSAPELRRLGQAGHVHLSSLVTLCARQHLLLLEANMPVTEQVTGGHRVMWQMGRAVETHVRAQLIAGMPTTVYGRWSCGCPTATERRGFKPDAGYTCQTCHGPLEFYRELTLVDEENDVAGNPDLIVHHSARYLPIEIKSMAKGQWDELRRPKPDHVIQVAGYRRLLQMNGYEVHDDVALVYCAKDFVFGSPYKEYHVNANHPPLVEALDRLFAEAKRVKDFIGTNRLPERTRCTAPTSTMAKKCPMVGACFARAG
jgi:hypothetical protein